MRLTEEDDDEEVRVLLGLLYDEVELLVREVLPPAVLRLTVEVPVLRLTTSASSLVRLPTDERTAPVD